MQLVHLVVCVSSLILDTSTTNERVAPSVRMPVMKLAVQSKSEICRHCCGIFFFFCISPSSQCAYEDVLTPAKAQFLLGVLKQASEFLSSALYVERFQQSMLKLIPISDESSELCDQPGLAVPPDYIINGLFDVDLVIFVTTWPARRSVRGFAQPCLYSDVNGRPVAGYINFSPRKLDSVATSFPTAIHELFHVLGFKRSIFPTFRDSNYTELKENFILGMDVLSRETLVTANAVERARAHFDCPELNGVPLENKNSDPGDHWEKTSLGDDLMTAALAPRFPPLSHITLGALADSGWYRVDYRRSSTFLFGSRQGCTFLSQPCSMRINDGYSECVAPTSCAFDQRSYGSCPNASVYSGPCLIPDTSVSCIDGVDPSTGAVLDKGDVVGPEVRCFMNKPAGGSLRANCLRHRCVDNQLSVELGGSWYMCSEAARIVSTTGGGELQCPASGDLCCPCTGSSLCLRGRCACNAGLRGRQLHHAAAAADRQPRRGSAAGRAQASQSDCRRAVDGRWRRHARARSDHWHRGRRRRLYDTLLCNFGALCALATPAAAGQCGVGGAGRPRHYAGERHHETRACANAARHRRVGSEAERIAADTQPQRQRSEGSQSDAQRGAQWHSRRRVMNGFSTVRSNGHNCGVAQRVTAAAAAAQ
jgi:hypothetical protein